MKLLFLNSLLQFEIVYYFRNNPHSSYFHLGSYNICSMVNSHSIVLCVFYTLWKLIRVHPLQAKNPSLIRLLLGKFSKENILKFNFSFCVCVLLLFQETFVLSFPNVPLKIECKCCDSYF